MFTLYSSRNITQEKHDEMITQLEINIAAAKQELICEYEAKLEERQAEINDCNEKIQTLKKQLEEYEKNLEKKDKLISRLNNQLMDKDNLIESIKFQYETLMDTAKRYQTEAIKWYEKYYRDHGVFQQ